MLKDLTKCPHSFLLTGETGCGKTTLGRIISTHLGANGADFREVDSADFRGIDTIREIRKQSQYRPLESERRVWLIDECFAKDTLIKTPKGDIPIQNIKIRDDVFSLAGKDRVVNTFQNKIPLDRVIKITLSNKKVIICSKNHLFFTENNWVKACDLEKNTLILPFVGNLMNNIKSQKNENNKTLSSMWNFDGLLSEQTGEIQQKILQSSMRGEMECESPRNERSFIQQKSKRKNINRTKEFPYEYNRRTEASGILFGQDEKVQSFFSGKEPDQSKTNKTNQRNITYLERGTRRKWKIDACTNIIINCFRMENGSSGKNRTLSFRQIRIPFELQSGFGLSGIEDSNRSRWERSFLEKRYRIRCKENKKIKPIRVESVEIYQRGNNEQSFSSIINDKERNQGFVILYDLQIKNHPSYFANNLAVHNCHKMTNDAQNALLKILEDTPQHVYFILCTTDPQKLIPTIKGRCSTFQVKPLMDSQMFHLLRSIVKAEEKNMEKPVYEQIILDAQGHARNALQVLDQVLRVDTDKRLEMARRSAEEMSQSIELCRALIGGSNWKKVADILKGLKDQEAEGIRRHVLGYAQSVLLNGTNDQAAAVIEAFLEPLYDVGFSGLVYGCYSVMK
jgi:DNA polymerase III gamma/tau subunit